MRPKHYAVMLVELAISIRFVDAGGLELPRLNSVEVTLHGAGMRGHEVKVMPLSCYLG